MPVTKQAGRDGVWDMIQHNVGSIDVNEMIRMNNLAVGYFPTETPEIGVYPPPQPPEPSIPEQNPEPVPVPVSSLEMSF